ncbi:MAG: hypothetical protein JNK05_22775 [Myxococcales bacterium]|nr:hypothetical protein [Myxococcales bacterium]
MQYTARVLPDAEAPLWTRSLAYAAGLSGVAPSSVAPWLTPTLAATLDALPAGDPRARARALAELRRAELRATDGRSAPTDEALSSLGARITASIVASSPPSVRSQMARAFDAATLRAAAQFAREPVTCDPFALTSVLDAIARITGAAPTAYALGAVAFAWLVDDSDAPRLAHDVLRSLRARAIDARSALDPFRALAHRARMEQP